MTETITAAAKDYRHRHWLTLGIVLIVSGLLLSMNNDEVTAARGDAPAASNQGNEGPPLSPPATGEGAAAQAAPVDVPAKWQTVKVRYGDSVSMIFTRLGVSPELLSDILSAGDAVASLKDIHPGQLIKVKMDASSQLLEMIYDMDPIHSLHVWQEGLNGFKSTMIERPVEHRTAHTAGIISSSLFESGQKAGLSDRLTMELASIFAWDIDFALNIRDGDRFSVVYNDLYVNGQLLRHGDILAAEFVNDGTVYRAVRYTDADGHTDYYTPGGKSLRKAFLRTPVEFTRISSYFTTARYHPILHRMRAHQGVDYAAPIGTPVKATGDGKVVFVGWRGGYGNAIELQHGARYSTLYGHLSRFARGVRDGSRVHQGQVIGYVGMTGLATGPHLHYEFRIDGVHRNPLKVNLPEAAPIEARYRQDFLRTSRPLLAQLGGGDNSAVALNDAPAE